MRRLMIDDFALHKGHRYATVVAFADTQKVVWIGEGRSSHEAIRVGRGSRTDRGRGMDMNSVFDLEVKAQCPNPTVVYDRFHVVAKYGRHVMDWVRVDQANQLRDNKAPRKLIKGSRWLMRNTNNLKREQVVKLEELWADNASLATAYLLKDQLKTLWFADDAATARNA
ncbi:MAG: transposase [Pseudomonadota bacterium]